MAENPKKPNEEPSFLNPEAKSEESFFDMDFLRWFFSPLLCVCAEYAVAFITDWSGASKFFVVCALFTTASVFVKEFNSSYAEKEVLAGNEARAKRILSLSKSSWRWILFSPVLAWLNALVFLDDVPLGYYLVCGFHVFVDLIAFCFTLNKIFGSGPYLGRLVRLNDVDRKLLEDLRKKMDDINDMQQLEILLKETDGIDKKRLEELLKKTNNLTGKQKK